LRCEHRAAVAPPGRARPEDLKVARGAGHPFGASGSCLQRRLTAIGPEALRRWHSGNARPFQRSKRRIELGLIRNLADALRVRAYP
jgi:hypothetical protein